MARRAASSRAVLSALMSRAAVTSAGSTSGWMSPPRRSSRISTATSVSAVRNATRSSATASCTASRRAWPPSGAANGLARGRAVVTARRESEKRRGAAREARSAVVVRSVSRTVSEASGPAGWTGGTASAACSVGSRAGEMTASAIAPAVNARLGDGQCSVASEIGPGHSRVSRRRGISVRRTGAAQYGRQWEPGQLVNSVDHANTQQECCVAEIAQSPSLNREKNASYALDR